MKYPTLKHILTGIAVISLMLISQVSAFPGTNREVLSQKILLENTIQQRVSDAIYKLLRNENFIVNVNVLMEATPGQEYTTVYETAGETASISPEQKIYSQSVTGTPRSAAPTGKPQKSPTVKGTKTVLKKRPIQTNIPSGIPGFPGIQRPGFELYEEEEPIEIDNTEDVIYAADDELSKVTEMEDTTANDVAAEASLSLDEGEVILEEDILAISSSDQTNQALVEYAEPNSPLLSRHTVASTTGPSLRVRKMELTVILEDPVSPKLIENIRSITMVASHFNRERGDKLQVMTADFQGKTNDKPDTEQLLLKSIAEKMTAIEARQKEEAQKQQALDLQSERDRVKQDQIAMDRRNARQDSIRNVELERQQAQEAEDKAEIARLRDLEEQRNIKLQAELDDMRTQREEALAAEQQKITETQIDEIKARQHQDSLRTEILNQLLSNINNQLDAVDIEEEQRLKLELEQKRREAEKQAILDREEKLDQQKNDLESQKLQASVLPNKKDNLLWLFIIGAAILVAFAIILGAMMGSRRQSNDMPPTSPDLAQASTEEVLDTPEAKEEILPEPEIDPELVGEVDSIKKSVVSLAVSKPSSASSIVKDWLQDTGEVEEEEEPAEEETNGKKKKKGRK